MNMLQLPNKKEIGALTLCHDEGWDSCGRDGGAHGVSLLGHVDLPVPAAPGLGGREHVTTAAHVAEGSLAGAVGAAAADPGNTGDGATSAPRFGRRLMACRIRRRHAVKKSRGCRRGAGL